jgi:hypothetical protein
MGLDQKKWAEMLTGMPKPPKKKKLIINRE